MLATMQGHEKVIKELVSQGADIHAKGPGRFAVRLYPTCHFGGNT